MADDIQPLSEDQAVAAFSGLLSDADLQDAPLESEAPQSTQLRAPDGKFAKGEPQERTESPQGETTQQTGEDRTAEEPSAIEPPSGWTDAEEAAFKAAPPELQQAVARREADRNRDLERRQSEFATKLKAFEANEQQMSQARQQLAQARQQLAQAIAQYEQPMVLEFQQKFRDVTDPIRLAAEDPARFAEYQAYMLKFQQIGAERHRLQDEQQKAESQRFEAWKSDERDKLFAAMPELKDEKKFESFKASIGKFLSDVGYSAEALTRISHRDLLVARDAKRWRDAEAARLAAEKTPKPAQRVQRPGTAQTVEANDKRDAAMERLRKSGSDKDAAAIFATMI